jgi:hypothetical protein
MKSENFLQFGFVWVDPTTLAKTNTLHSTTNLSSGNGAYIVAQGYQPSSSGTVLMGFYTGGSNNPTESQGSTNRVNQSNINYADNNLTFVLKKDTGTNARKMAIYTGDTKIYTWSQQIPSSTSNVYFYVGHGFSSPENNFAQWNVLSPKLRYSASTNYNFTV